MLTFKDFFIESVYKDFYDPPFRAKFQIDDIVVVRDSGKWLTYQSKKTLPYINQIGRVVAYKNVPGAYSKFAIEFFSDKSIHGIHGHFIYGPFKDVKVAEKYSKDPNLTIIPADIVKSGSKESYSGPLQNNERFEKKIVEVFCNSPIGFNWLPTPLQFPTKDGKTTTTVLAVKPIKDLTPSMAQAKLNQNKFHLPDLMDKDNIELINLIKTNYIIVRFNNSVTKKLKNLTFTETFEPSDAKHSHFFNNAPSPYAVYFPYKNYISDDIKASINYDDITRFLEVAFTPKFLTLTPKNLSHASIINDTSEIIDNINNATPEKLFYSINPYIEIKNNKKYVKGHAEVSDVNEKWFLDCDFSDRNARYIYYLNNAYNSVITNINIPSTVHKLSITTKKHADNGNPFDWSNHHTAASRSKRVIQDLTFLPPNIKSLEVDNVHLNSVLGLPKIMDDLQIRFADLTSLDNFPKKVNDHVDVSYNNLENFKGSLEEAGRYFSFTDNPVKSLEGIPEADQYVLATDIPFTLDDIKKYKHKKQYTKDLDKSVISTFDDLLDEL